MPNLTTRRAELTEIAATLTGGATSVTMMSIPWSTAVIFDVRIVGVQHNGGNVRIDSNGRVEWTNLHFQGCDGTSDMRRIADVVDVLCANVADMCQQEAA